jgi:hypothetical protein
MKILWIYKYSASYNLDKWFHLEYVRWMKNNGYDIVAYGPGIHEVYPDIAPLAYVENTRWDSLLDILKPDVCILNTKSRMFEHYSPHTGSALGCILPIGFETSKRIPKVMIEEDAHYEKNGKWYQEVGIDLLLQRHYSQSLRDWGVKTLWHPFSVDETIFCPDDCQRTNKVCFSGHITSPYPERRRFCDLLKNQNLIDVFEHKEKINEKYIKCLQEYVAHLSTASIYDITAAKNFEIMSSGSILITPKFSGIDLLFPEDSYCEINLDGSDIVEKVRKILPGFEYRKNIVDNGLRCIKERHTNKVRTKELIEILEKEL